MRRLRSSAYAAPVLEAGGYATFRGEVGDFLECCPAYRPMVRFLLDFVQDLHERNPCRLDLVRCSRAGATLSVISIKKGRLEFLLRRFKRSVELNGDVKALEVAVKRGPDDAPF